LFLRSAPGRGAVFAIEVPALAPPGGGQHAEPPPPCPPPALPPLCILVIEDDPAQAAALATILSDQGHHVTVAQDVASARAALPERLDLIISDYRLPGGVTGLDGIGQLRQAAGRRIPALLLTGDTQATIAAAGCALLHKPCAPAAILAAAAGLLAEGGS
jgi:CheY-like chemotaxis protein